MSDRKGRLPRYVLSIEQDRQQLARQLDNVNAGLVDLYQYLRSPKFHGPDSDYVHVTTDLLPKVTELLNRAR